MAVFALVSGKGLTGRDHDLRRARRGRGTNRPGALPSDWTWIRRGRRRCRRRCSVAAPLERACWHWQRIARDPGGRRCACRRSWSWSAGSGSFRECRTHARAGAIPLAWDVVAAALPDLDESGVDVLIDGGRLDWVGTVAGVAARCVDQALLAGASLACLGRVASSGWRGLAGDDAARSRRGRCTVAVLGRGKWRERSDRPLVDVLPFDPRVSHRALRRVRAPSATIERGAYARAVDRLAGASVAIRGCSRRADSAESVRLASGSRIRGRPCRRVGLMTSDPAAGRRWSDATRGRAIVRVAPREPTASSRPCRSRDLDEVPQASPARSTTPWSQRCGRRSPTSWRCGCGRRRSPTRVPAASWRGPS